LKIAISQTNINFEDYDFNINLASSLIESAKNSKATLIVFPEMSFTGFSMNTNKIAAFGKLSIAMVKELSQNYNISIGFGWVNLQKNGMAENHYSIINGKGDMILDYVKIHPFSYLEEDKYFVKGNKISCCEVDSMPISCFICYDLRFPEIFRAVSKKVSMIIIAANWPRQRIHHWKSLLIARAIENQVYIVGVNCVGKQKNILYSGSSIIINPNGEILMKSGNMEAFTLFDIENDVHCFRKSFPVRKDIRNDLYFRLREDEYE